MKALALLAILAVPARADTWFTTRAGNFIVYTNIDAPRAVHTAETLERMRAALALTTTLDTSVADPIRVYVFRTTKDYLHYGRIIVGDAPEKDGLSIIHPIAKAILLDGSRLRSDALLQHELAHHFARQTWKRLPLWLDEGLAEFYSTMRVRGDVVEIGRARDQHRRMIRRAGAIPMRDFFSAGPRSHWYAEPFLEKRFYAQAWLLVHWLMIKRQADVGTVAEAFVESAPETAVASLFRINPPTLQRELLRYNLLPALPSREIRIRSLDVDAPEAPRVLADDEIESMLTWTLPVPAPVRTITVQRESTEHLARYDEAANQVARGELASALESLEALIPALPEGELLAQAKTLREQVREIVRKNRRGE